MDTQPPGKLPLVACFMTQLGIALAGLIGLIFAPPAQGKILLVPLTASARARLPIAAFGNQALLLGQGPLPGSLVVMEDRQNLTWMMLRLGVLSVAASPAGCGPLVEGTVSA